MNEVINTIMQRRSIRAYEPRQIEPAVLDAILDAGIHAPTARNDQSCKLVLVQGQNLKRLGAAVREAILSGKLPHARTVSPDYVCYYNAPTLVVACDLKSRSQQLCISDCACMLQTMFLAAESLGVGSCWINQLIASCDISEVRAVLTECGMPQDYAVFGSAALGYAQTKPQPRSVLEGRIIKNF